MGRRAYDAAVLRGQRGQGRSLRAIAKRLDVSHETVRADLQKVTAFARSIPYPPPLPTHDKMSGSFP